MTFIGHGLIGASTEAGLAHVAGARHDLCFVFAIHGFLGGCLPDIVDWIAWRFFGHERWSIYVEMHHGTKYWWLAVLFPAFVLHTAVVDPFFHNPEKPRNWWPRLWWAEILGWIIPAIVLFLVFAR